MNSFIYFIEITENNAPVFDDARLLRFVSEEKRRRLENYHFPIDRKLSLYAELLVRVQAAALLGLHNSDIVFNTNKYGKPYLKDNPDFHFNFSHTRNAIMVAFSDNEIGVDIERIRPCDLKIAKRFFTPDETEYIQESCDIDKAFYEIWTKKEAYIKNIGTGLSTRLHSFNILHPSIKPTFCIFEKDEYFISACSKSFVSESPAFVVLTENELMLSFFSHV